MQTRVLVEALVMSSPRALTDQYPLTHVPNVVRGRRVFNKQHLQTYIQVETLLLNTFHSKPKVRGVRDSSHTDGKKRTVKFTSENDALFPTHIIYSLIFAHFPL